MTATTVDRRPRLPSPRPREAPASGGRRGTGARWLLLLPALIPVLVLSVFPLVRGIYLGFTDARAGLNVETNFTGFANFTKLLARRLFWDSFRIGLIWALR